MSIELSRRELPDDADNAKRNLELAAYFTRPSLQLPHRQIALVSGMKAAYQKKNMLLANHFASRILANSKTGKIADQVCSMPL